MQSCVSVRIYQFRILIVSSFRCSLMRIFPWQSLSWSSGHVVRGRRHQSCLLKQAALWMIKCLFFGCCLKKIWSCCVSIIQSDTINEPNIFEQELTQLLIPICWLLFVFWCYLFEATPQQGGPGREATLCHQPLPPAPTLPDKFALQCHLERNIGLGS